MKLKDLEQFPAPYNPITGIENLYECTIYMHYLYAKHLLCIKYISLKKRKEVIYSISAKTKQTSTFCLFLLLLLLLHVVVH